MSEPRRAAIYARISKDKTGAGLGVERQTADCVALAQRLGLVVIFVFSDNDISAYSGKRRPGYLKLLDVIRRGEIDVVIAWHSDRLHRSPTELEEYISVCEARNVPTETVTAGALDLSTPSGRMGARIHGAVARHEVEHMIERQRGAKLQASAQGRWKGGRRPFGYAADGLTVIPEEAREVVDMCRAMLAGASLSGIAASLNARGVPTSTGGEWRQDAVRRVASRARNAGLMVHRGQVTGKAEWPAIVDEQTWRAVVALLGNPDRRSNYSTGRVWLGGGLYRCHCGEYVKTSKTTNSRPASKTDYTCAGPTKHLTRNALEVDRHVVLSVVKRLSRPDAAVLLDDRDATDRTAELQDRAAAIRSRLDEAGRLYGAGTIDARQLAEATETLRGNLKVVEQQLAGQVPGRGVLVGLVGAADVDAAWDQLELGEQRTAIDALCVVILLPSNKGRPAGWKPGGSYFRPETVRVEWRE
jgi:site-specific DNA recombinase